MNGLPRDPVLPQLPLALDGAAMAAAFGDVLRAHDMQVEGCVVERIKYRPGRNATLAYRLLLRDRLQRPLQQLVGARLCGGQGAARSARASTAELIASPAGPALRWLPALDMLTWWWPNDSKLDAPRRLGDRALVHDDLLPALAAAVGVERATFAAEPIEVVQYVPEHRLCVRADLQCRNRGAVWTQRVYGKASREPDGQGAHRMLAQIEASAAWRTGRLRTPRALLWHAPSQTCWQEGLPGRPLLDAGAGAMAACAAALGMQLAALHATPVATPREITRDSLRARMAEVVAVLGPIVGERDVQRAGRALDAGWDALDGQHAPATLHGDFHPRNILVDGAAVALIDLDGARRGPAVLELGAWIADAIYRALLDGAAPRRDEAAWRALLQAYVDAGGARPDARALQWATAWALLTQRAWRCVVNLKPGRWEVAPRLVALAADWMQARSEEVAAC